MTTSPRIANQTQARDEGTFYSVRELLASRDFESAILAAQFFLVSPLWYLSKFGAGLGAVLVSASGFAVIPREKLA